MGKRYKKSDFIYDGGYETSIREYYTDNSGRKRSRKVWVCPYYVKWRAMITRCYDESQRWLFPTYEDVEVCESWLRFSNFKMWMKDLPWEERSLDKDLYSIGKRYKEYSPETCVFLPQEINTLLICLDTPPKKKVSVNGVITYISKIGNNHYFGSYSNRENAVLAKKVGVYKIAKQLLDNTEYDLHVLEILADTLRVTDDMDFPPNSAVFRKIYTSDLFGNTVSIETSYNEDTIASFREYLLLGYSNNDLQKATGIPKTAGCEIKNILKYPSYLKEKREKFLESIPESFKGQYSNTGDVVIRKILLDIYNNPFISYSSVASYLTQEGFPVDGNGVGRLALKAFSLNNLQNIIDKNEVSTIEELKVLSDLPKSRVEFFAGSCHRKVKTRSGKVVLVNFKSLITQEKLDIIYNKLDEGCSLVTISAIVEISPSYLHEISKNFYKEVI